MKRLLVIGLVLGTSAGVTVSPASGAKQKPLTATSNGWYVFDGVGTATPTPKNGTYTRCVSDPSTPPVIALGARYSIKNRSAPKGTKFILNGPSGLHLVATRKSALAPGNYYHVFRASKAGKSSFSPGKYVFKMKVGSKVLTTESIKLVDDTTC